MMEVKDAYKVLGLEEGAPGKEIEKRYTLLAMRYRAQLAQVVDETVDEGSRINMDEINEAYRRLADADEEARNIKLNIKPNSRSKKVGNFFHYHKFHIIIALIIIIAAGTVIKDVITQKDSDSYVAFIGNFQIQSVDKLETGIKNGIPELKNKSIGIESYYYSDVLTGQEKYATEMKASMLMSEKKYDIFILDKKWFSQLVTKGVFNNLDEVATKLGVDKSKNAEYVVKLQGEDKGHLYGIDVSNSKLLNELGVFGPEKILVIHSSTEHYEQSIGILKLFLK